MPHRVTFESFGKVRRHVSEEEVRDLVEVLYRGRWSIHVIGGRAPGKKPGTRGTCISTMGAHTVYLSADDVVGTIGSGRMGGNFPAPTVRLGLAMVLAHELQHANQVFEMKKSDGKKPFQKYVSRAEEVDARRFVDENIEVIARVVDEEAPYGVAVIPVQATKGPGKVDLEMVADDLGECPKLTFEDLHKELRSLGTNDPVSFGNLLHLLRDRGISVVK